MSHDLGLVDAHPVFECGLYWDWTGLKVCLKATSLPVVFVFVQSSAGITQNQPITAAENSESTVCNSDWRPAVEMHPGSRSQTSVLQLINEPLSFIRCRLVLTQTLVLCMCMLQFLVVFIPSPWCSWLQCGTFVHRLIQHKLRWWRPEGSTVLHSHLIENVCWDHFSPGDSP